MLVMWAWLGYWFILVHTGPYWFLTLLFSLPPPTPSPSPSLHLALAGAWWALKGRGLDGHHPGGRGLDGRGWGRLLALLEAVGGGAPALLRPRHRAGLGLGLKAQVVTSLLQELGPAPTVLDALDWLFPEGAGPGDGHALGTLQGRPLVGVAEEHFREQVLGILGSGRGLEAFLQAGAGAAAVAAALPGHGAEEGNCGGAQELLLPAREPREAAEPAVQALPLLLLPRPAPRSCPSTRWSSCPWICSFCPRSTAGRRSPRFPKCSWKRCCCWGHQARGCSGHARTSSRC
ncbi:TERF1-interacting nuclear factor 2 [Zonotrichia albicollis]|uniref:TERF1-interacting nuclear factor 2 n=1 Tax=Zonotrichia albicollis TaxID=44394 RepID=UPI003D80D25D